MATEQCGVVAENPRAKLEKFWEEMCALVAKHPPQDRLLFQKMFVTAFTTGDKEERREAVATMVEIVYDHADTRAFVQQWALGPAGDETEVHDPKLKQWMTHVARVIKKLRNDKEWSQDDLANEAGLTQSHISRIENLYHAPSHKTLKKIAKALGVSVGDIDPVD